MLDAGLLDAGQGPQPIGQATGFGRAQPLQADPVLGSDPDPRDAERLQVRAGRPDRRKGRESHVQRVAAHDAQQMRERGIRAQKMQLVVESSGRTGPDIIAVQGKSLIIGHEPTSHRSK